MRAIVWLAVLAVSGCAALSPTQGPKAQQGGVNVGDILPKTRIISPDTAVAAGRDLAATVEAAVAKATAGRDQQAEIALKLLAEEQRIRASEGSHVSAPSMTQGLDGWDVAVLAFGVALAATLGHVLMMLANRLTRRWFPDPREAPMQTARPTPPP